MIEADSYLKLLPTSILDIYKVFEHIDMLSMGIQYQPYTVITTLLCSDFGALGPASVGSRSNLGNMGEVHYINDTDVFGSLLTMSPLLMSQQQIKTLLFQHKDTTCQE
jgi:hypothetical protein